MLLLLKHQVRFGMLEEPPVPIEEIVEHTLNLHVEFDDLVSKHGERTLGAFYRDRRTIVIDESLDPEVDPSKEGRYRFTLAHEVHHALEHSGAEGMDLEQYSADPSRVSSARELEWQANTFASHLLMPEHLIRRAWEGRHPGPLAITEEMVLLGRQAGFMDRKAFVNSYLENEAKALAVLFKVSRQAMLIRLQGLGLLPPSE